MNSQAPEKSFTFVDRVPIRLRMLIVGLAVIAAMGVAGTIAYDVRQNALDQAVLLYDTIFQSASYTRAAQTDWERLSTMVLGAQTLADGSAVDAFTQAAYGQPATQAAEFYLTEALANLQVAADSNLNDRMAERCAALIDRITTARVPIIGYLDPAVPSTTEAAAALNRDMSSIGEALELFVQDLAAEGFRIQEGLSVRVKNSLFMFIGALSAAAIIVLALSAFFGAHILGRLHLISEFSNRVAEGELDSRVTIKGRSELTVLMQALVRMRDAIRRQMAEADRLRREADALLDSILPPEIAARLKAGEERIADARTEGTIVFLDLSGFTELSRRMGPGHLIETIDGIFSELDEAAEKHRIQKIKTIGDGYMAAAGVTQVTARDDAARCAAFALEARQIIRTMAERLGYPLDVRIGIHNGPVVAGILGKSRLSFDVWGETVNLAARLESSAAKGEIRVSEAAYWRLHRDFRLTPLGEVSLKGVGDTPVFVLEDSLGDA